MAGLVNLIALAVLIAVIWFGGGYFEFGVGARIITIVAVLVFWLLLYLFQRLRAVRTANLIEKRLREQAADQIASSRPAERDQLEDLERRLKEAIHALKQSKLGKSALAELPWYMFIGPPGSGKSTALQESGLEFPQVGQGLNGIQGVGGTRNCEWWFTSEGILLDTAGRYTTVAEDREEWLSFLGMIKKARNRTPINGALVAISVAEVLAADEEELERHAKAIRERLDELCQELQVVFPIYLVFTKCDLLAGFVEFFESLGRAEREQVWGYTFPYEEYSAERYRQTFLKESRALYERLTRMRLQLLTEDRPPEKALRLYSFPLQFVAVQEKLGRLIEQTFRQNPFKESPILRGFYFTSGTQEGSPVDQVLGAMRQAFGVKAAAEGQQPSEPEVPVNKKSYFITDLFRKVIFVDRGLARSLAGAEMRRRVSQWAAIVGGIVVTLFLLFAMVISVFSNRGLISRASVGISAVRASRANERTPNNDRLAALEQLRGVVAELYEYDDGFPPLRMTWGLYQGGSLSPTARELYFAELRDLLLEPCMKGLAKELARAVEPQVDVKALKRDYGYEHDQELYDGLYRLLRTYLMLGNELEPAPVDVSDELQLRNRWLRGLGVDAKGSLKEDMKARADAQLVFLLTQFERANEWAPELDDALVHRVRQKLEANYWVSQSYTQIRDTRQGQAGEESVAELLGEGGKALFAPVDPVSKVFSKAEWEEYFERAIGEKSAYLAAQYAEMKTPKDEAQIREELKGYYELEGRQRWNRFMDALHVTPFTGIEEAAERLAVLGTQRSPLEKVLADVWPRQFVLSEAEERARLTPRPPPKKPEPGQEPQSWQEQARAAFAELGLAFEDVGKKPQGERFWPLAAKDQLAQLDPLRKTFGAVRTKLLDEVLVQVPAKQEQLAKRLFEEVLDAAQAALQASCMAEANAFWKDGVHTIFVERCAARYPFLIDAQDEAPLTEVANLFNPVSGKVWAAHSALTRLKAYDVGGRGLVQLGPRYAKALASAERLKDALFAKDAQERSVALKIKLIKRAGVKNVRLVLGQDAFKEGDLPPGQRKEMVWNMEPGAKVGALGVDQSDWAHKDYGNSPWGLVRLLAAGTFDVENSRDRTFRYTWVFEFGEVERQVDVEFEVADDSAAPVFRGTLFRDLDGPPERVEQ